MPVTSPCYIEASYDEPHLARTRSMLKDHPDLKNLFGPYWPSAFFIVAIVGAQIFMAVWLSSQPWYWIALAAYFFGAFADHALFVFIHECTHNLVFRSSKANILMSFVANLPHVFATAHAFRNYHLLHHRHQGELELDADLPGPDEIRFFGKSSFGKLMWLFSFWLILGIVRPMRLRKVVIWDRWMLLNNVLQIGFVMWMVYLFGWGAFAYLLLSVIFSIGLHPVGGRWIQEHYVFQPNQETYSYYGPLNSVAFNVGFHNEHHDLMRVAWVRLPEVRRRLPKYYDSLYSHTSWTMLVLKFIFDSNVQLDRRVVRESKTPVSQAAEEVTNQTAQKTIAHREETVQEIRA